MAANVVGSEIISIIIDTGSWQTKAGFSTDKEPLVKFRSVVGTPRLGELSPDRSKKVGDDAMAIPSAILLKKYPVEYGYVCNWELYEDLLKYIYDSRLCVPSEDYPAIFVEPVLNPRLNREKLVQVMFEDFNVPAIYLGAQASFALKSAGILGRTGMVIDVGVGSMHSVPIYEGHYLPFCLQRTDITGSDIPYSLMKFASTPKHTFQTTQEMNLLNSLFQKHAYVSLDYESEEKKNSENLAVSVPIGEGMDPVIVDRAWYRCMEPLFQPNIGGFERVSLPYMAWSTILKCDPSIRKQLCRNIVLSGGYACVPGFAERMEKEISVLARDYDEYKIKVISHPTPTYSAWAGAQLMASQPDFWLNGMSKDQYDEHGPSLANRLFYGT